jgi:photosystem II PsbH protein
MESNQYQPKRIAPLQYLFRKMNTNSGRVVRGWGTMPIMAALMLLFLVFLLIILQIANASIVLDGFDVDWSVLSHYATAETPLTQIGSFGSTAGGIFLGLLTFALCCGVLVAYGFFTYPKNQK